MGAAVAIFLALFPGAAISHFHRTAVSVIAPDIMAEIGLTHQEFGTMASGMFFGIALAQIPTGILLDRFGPRITIPVMQIVAVAGTVMFAAADSLTDLFIARFLIGVGFGSTFMGGLVVAARWFPRDRFALVTALFLGGSSGIGNLLAATPMAALTGWIGWRWAFAWVAVATLMVALFTYLIVRDAPPDHPYHSRRPETLSAVLKGIGPLLNTPRLAYIIALAMVGYPTLVAILGTWGGPYLHDVHGLDGIGRGNVLSVMAVAVIIGLVFFGPLDRYFDTRKWVVISGASLAAVVLAVLAMAPGLGLWQVTVLFALYGLLGSFYVTNFAFARSLFPDHMVGRGITIVNFGNFIGVALTQVMTGLIVGHFAAADGPVPELAYRLVFAYLAAAMVLVLLFYARVRESRPSED
ncbi:MAG: MFS transporter [Proteobacteria bacterium]|nr:MFS transporter [Pseudomonadota bacterium]